MRLLRWSWLLLLPVSAFTAYAARVHLFKTEPLLDYPAVVDFGEREQGSMAETRVIFTNRGQKELIIDRVRSECSCSGLELIENGQFCRFNELRIPPRQSRELAIRVAVRGRAGEPLRTAVTFQTNAPRQRHQRVDIVVPKLIGLSVLPTSIVFGDVLVGTDAVKEIEINEVGGKAFEFTGVATSASSMVSVNVLPLESSGPRIGETIERRLLARLQVKAAAAEEGSLDGIIQLQLLRQDTPVTVEIPVCGRVVPPVLVLPNEIALPRSSTDGPVYYTTCLCKHLKNGNFSLAVESVSAGLTARVEEVVNSTSIKLVHVEWAPRPSPRGERRGFGVVLLKAADGTREYELPIKVELRLHGDGS